MITVLIPVFNEERSVAGIIKEVFQLKFDKEIVVVDDGSTDKSFDIVKGLVDTYRVRLIKHKKNMGKGVAIKTGIKFARGDYFIIQDADFEYEPQDLEKIVRLIQPRDTNAYFFGIGYRKLNLGLNFRFFHNFINHLMTMLINILFGGTIKDSYSGCKLFPLKFLKTVKLRSKRFEFEAEVCIKLLKKRYKVKQVQIKYIPRRAGEGKKIGIIDAIKGIIMIITERLLY
ncbi:MAG: glycosyltransferase family 2 protein [Planctomycetota bacterium]